MQIIAATDNRISFLQYLVERMSYTQRLQDSHRELLTEIRKRLNLDDNLRWGLKFRLILFKFDRFN